MGGPSGRPGRLPARGPCVPLPRSPHPRARPVALSLALPPSQGVLHDVEELLLGVDAELGVDGPAVGVGGVAGDVELGADEADVAAAGEQGEDLGLARREAVLGCDLGAVASIDIDVALADQGEARRRDV